MKRSLFSIIFVAFLLPVGAVSQRPQESIDTAAVSRIEDEGMNRSRAMELMSYLTDIYGPRLTGSPQYAEAAEWARKTLSEWGVQNVMIESWGPFGRGWSLKHFSALMTEPRMAPLIAYPKAWSPGLKGTVRSDVVYLDVKSEADLQKFSGKLKGKFVLISEPPQVTSHFEPEARRTTDEMLLKLANADVSAGRRRRGNFGGDSAAVRKFMEQMKLASAKLEFCQREKAAAVLSADRGDGGVVVVQSASVPQPVDSPFTRRISPYDVKAPKIISQIVVAAEQYNRMVRAIQKGRQVSVEMDLKVEFTGEQPGFNVMGEIPGTDLKDEIVMVGAHLDSWAAGTGACDNASGVVSCMETMRVLKALDLKPRRTIRIGLWGGEEEGLLGSRAYVAKYLAEPDISRISPRPPRLKPDYEKFYVYFNNDNGTGKLRGIYLQGNEAARTIFRAWLAPFAHMGASTISLANTGGTDHLSFDGVGLPGFQFIQDPIEYGRTYHSNMDVYERVQEDDLKQASTVMAAFAYDAAMREGRFPRKPMPAPRPSSPAGNGN